MTFKEQLQKKIEREVESYDSSHLSEKQSYRDGVNLLSELLVECYEAISGVRTNKVGPDSQLKVIQAIHRLDTVLEKLNSFVKEGAE